jgi:glycosyltransferase involved in cell wall biosynthesis
MVTHFGLRPRPPGAEENVTASDHPEVSVCIPVFNGEPWIQRAVDSALAQTYSDLEVVVVDNASTDGTRERVREIEDPRLRLYVNSHNLGISRNFNRAVALARGRYIKFLCADDVIYPECVEAMLRVFESDDRVGLVFSRRDTELEDPADPLAIRWKSKHERAHEHFGALREVNSGEALLEAWLGDQLANNWIGEPTNVMMTRECLARIGTFNVHVRERDDMDVWVRAMRFYSIGYVDRPLARFLVQPASDTSSNRRTHQAWLDRVWFLEGLLTYDEFRGRYPKLRWLRTKALLRLVRHRLTGRTPKDGKVKAIGHYLRFRLGARHDPSEIYGSIDDRGPAGETVEYAAADQSRSIEPDRQRGP